MRYLIYSYAIGAIRNRKGIQQFLGSRTEQDFSILSYITIYKPSNTNTFVTLFQEVFDQGNAEWTDITTFENLDPDNYEVKNQFNTPEEAFDFAVSKYNADPNKFVNMFVIEEEYKDYLRKKAS